MKQRECECLASQLVVLRTDDLYSIYLVHDDAEKAFELEMSWIGDETDGRHLPVPKGLLEEAEQKAKAALENFD